MAYRYKNLHITIVFTALALIMTFVFYYCSTISGRKKYPQELISADSLCDTYPEKALSYLYALKSKTERMPNEDKWYYRLLLVKAKDKNYIEAQNTDEPQKIVNYYEKSYADKSLLPYAYYYLGSAYRDTNNVPMALELYQKAYKTANDEDLNFRSALNFQIGFILLEQSLNKECLPYFWKSFNVEKKQKDTKMMAYVMQKIAYAYQANNNDSCVVFYLKAAKLAKETKGEELYDEILSSLASYYINNKKYGTALKYARPALSHTDMGMKAKASFIEVMATSHMNLGNTDSAAFYYHKLEDIDLIEAKEVASKNLARIYNKKKDTDKTIHYMNMHEECEDSVDKINSTNSVAKWNAIYNYSSLKEKNADLERKSLCQTFLLIIFIMAFVFLSILFYIWHKKNARNSKEKELRLKVLRNESHDGRIKEDEALEKLSTLPSYTIVQRRATEKNPLTDEDFLLLDKNINELFPNFKAKLYSAYEMSNRDYRLCLLMKMFRFSDTSIAILMSRERSTISKAKKKLYLRILGKDSNMQEFEDFIRRL